MRTWPVQVAKASFSELLEQSISDGPQLVTRRGAVRRLRSWFPWLSGMHCKPGRSGHSRMSFWTLRIRRWMACKFLSVAAYGGDWRVSMFLLDA